MAPVAQRDAGPGLFGVSPGEACTALDTVLRKELPLAKYLAAGVPSICAYLMCDNPASLFEETSQGWDVSKDCYPEGRSVGRQGG